MIDAGTDAFPTAVDDRYFPPAGALTAPDCGLEPDFFEPAPYVGAFEPGGSTASGASWLAGSWVSFSAQ